MNAVHFHLVLNHLPVIGNVFTVVLLGIALWRKSDQLKRVALSFVVLVMLAAVPAYLTGEPAEESVENLAGVSEALVEEHEQAAQWALGSQIALGLVALIGLFASRRARPLPGWLAPTVFTLMIVVSGLMAWTANLGGRIRHPEIRADQSLVAAPAENEDR